MKNRLVSILMPAYNAAAFIRSSIESILSQKFEDFELLIVNDGSTDETISVIQSFQDERIRLIDRRENRGLVYTLNEGLAEARGQLIARQDADDLSQPDRLGKQVDYFLENPEMFAVGSEALLINTQGRRCGVMRMPRTSAQLAWDLCFRNPVPHTSVMMRKEAVMKNYGGYTDSEASEDYALWSLIARDGRFGILPERLVSYRIHPTSIMMGGGQGRAEIARIRQSNLHDLLGHDASVAELQTLAQAWDEPAQIEWSTYCTTYERLAAIYESKLGVLGLIPSIHYQTLLSQGGELAPLCRMLWGVHRKRLTQLPWMRILGSCILNSKR